MSCTLDRAGSVATITFESPAHNALSSGLLDQIIDHIAGLNGDLSIKSIVLKSEGDRTFCAGADLSELLILHDEASGIAFFYRFAQLIIAIRNSPHLVLCRVQGKAIGGAVGIIAAADYVVATDEAQVRLSELINGIGPFVVGPAIERKIGLAAFNHMTLSPAVWHSAVYAMQHGLYNEVRQDRTALDQAISDKLNEWSEYSARAMQETKKMLWSSTAEWDSLLKERAAVSGRLILSLESKKALNKLIKK